MKNDRNKLSKILLGYLGVIMWTDESILERAWPIAQPRPEAYQTSFMLPIFFILHFIYEDKTAIIIRKKGVMSPR